MVDVVAVLVVVGEAELGAQGAAESLPLRVGAPHHAPFFIREPHRHIGTVHRQGQAALPQHLAEPFPQLQLAR